VKTEDVVLTSLKQAEHQEGIILRLVEYNGQTVTAEIELNPALLRKHNKVTCVDVLERETEGDAELKGNVLKVKVKGKSFTTVLIT